MSEGPSFSGVISLRTREEVIALIEAVSRLVTAGNIFENLQRDSQSWRPLLSDIIIINRSAASFCELCIDPQGKERTRQLVDRMENSKTSLGQIFLNLNGRFPSPQEQQEITTEFQNVLFSMADVTDIMEEDQVIRIQRAAKLAFQHVLTIRDTSNSYRIEPKLEDLRFAVDSLLKNLDNRLNILHESPLAQDLACARGDIANNLDYYINNTRLYVTHGTADARRIQESSLEPIVLGIKTVIDLIGDTLTKGNCNFPHEQILQDLDRLANAVKHGSASEAAGSARLLVEELNKMQASADEDPDNSGLNDSCNRLSEMTKRLLAATKNALANQSDSANDELVATVDGIILFFFLNFIIYLNFNYFFSFSLDVKDHIIEVADVGRKSGNDLRMQLLKAAKCMSNDMSSLTSTLQTATQ